jgi:hypothetical protein
MQYIISTTLATMLRREATTPLATALGRVMGYRGLKPPTTESSKGKHPCWGEKTAGEENEVFNKHSAWGTTPTTTLLGEQPQQSSRRKRIQPMPGI